MTSSRFETQVNAWRGYCTVFITMGSFVCVLTKPECLVFWQAPGRRHIDESAGTFGIIVGLLFLAYLVIDMAVAVACRRHFRRSMGAVYLHHVVCAVATACFVYPEPPRGLFIYLWGEALTACRVLPPAPRWHARSAVFAGRRALWCYLFVRDVYLYKPTARHHGLLAALVPPGIALILFSLDVIWWREHAKSGAAHGLGPISIAVASDDNQQLLPARAPGSPAHGAASPARSPARSPASPLGSPAILEPASPRLAPLAKAPDGMGLAALDGDDGEEEEEPELSLQLSALCGDVEAEDDPEVDQPV